MSENIQVSFNKSSYKYWEDTLISGYISWIQEESISITIELVLNSDSFRPIALLKSHKILVESSNGYYFQFPLEYPNIDRNEKNIYTAYLCNIMKIKGISIEIPIIIKNYDIIKKNTESFLETQGDPVHGTVNYIILDWKYIKNLFQKRTISNPLQPDIVRIPWSWWDIVDAHYYYSIVNQSFFSKAAHYLYLYNIDYIVVMAWMCSLIMTLLITPQFKTFWNVFIWIDLLIGFSYIAIFLIQWYFKSKISPKDYYPKLKKNEDIEIIFQQGNFLLKDIFDFLLQDTNNFLSQAPGTVSISFVIYDAYLIQSQRYNKKYRENIYIKKILQKQFSSLSELSYCQLNLYQDENILPFLKNRKDIEKIGIFIWFDAFLEYDQYPDKTYKYNLSRNMYTY